MKMYHVSTEIFKDIKIFNPRIPKSRLKNEDATIPRVCISDDIKNCLNGMCYMEKYWKYLTDDLESNQYFIDDVCLRLLKVYEFEVDNNDSIKSPKYLYDNNLVPDSNITNEYWSLRELRPIKSYLIKITDLEYEDKISELKYEIINPSLISEKVKLQFSKVNQDMIELFNSKEESSLCYDVLDIDDNSIIISTKNYPMENNDFYNIFNRYFKSYEDCMDFKYLNMSTVC